MTNKAEINQYQPLKDKDSSARNSDGYSADFEDGIDTPRLSVQNYRNHFAEDAVRQTTQSLTKESGAEGRLLQDHFRLLVHAGVQVQPDHRLEGEGGPQNLPVEQNRQHPVQLE